MPDMLSPGELYCGKQTMIRNETLYPDILAEQEKRLSTAIQGLAHSVRESDRERRSSLQAAAAEITEWRREYHGDST